MDPSASPDSHGRQSRRELLATIAQQEEQISQQKKRLKDVVRAYKGLAIEKEALEKSVAVLGKPHVPDKEIRTSVTKHPTVIQDTSLLSSDITDTPSIDRKSNKKSEKLIYNTNNPDTAERDTASDLKVLQDSLATLTAEKSRMENAYQEEKRRIRQEKQDIEKATQQANKELESLKIKFKLETEELKSKWIVERHNREKESNDHALMLRELQKLVGEERAAKERLELELQEARDKLKGLQMAGSFNEEYEKRVRTLELEAKQKNEEISRLSTKCEETPPELIRLRQEAEDMRHDHRRNLENAETRASNAEKQSTTGRAAHEKRVVNLESRLQVRFMG